MASKKQEVAAGANTPMCANGCGYFGSAGTKNLCSHCYKDHVMKTAAAAVAAAPVAEKKANVAPAPAPAEKASATDQKHQGSSAAVAEKKVDAAPAPAAETKESGSSADAEKTTDKHEVSSSSSGAAAAAAPVMCVNGCTFFGSAATKNMCSSCYREFLLKDAHAAPAVAEKVIEVVAPAAPPEISASTSSSASAPAVKAAPNRCAGAGCKKKVGLLGFVCRCGGTFCSVHRYTDKHACDFDFKTAAREEIAKKNPLVVAPKINKI